MKLLFIPNWNGHLFLQEYNDKSISTLYEKVKFENKKLLKIEKNNIERTNKLIEKEFLESYNKESFVLSITGDHSNSYPLVRAFSKNNKISLKSFKLVIFDAHPDVEVSTSSVSHEDYLRNLIEDNVVKPEDIYLFGIRTFSRTEFEYLQKKKVNFWSISDVLRNKDKVKEVLNSIKEDIYLSIDIDVLDPDAAPGTYYREWCGLYIDELLEFIEAIKLNVKSCDITEYYKEKDENNITEKNVLKLIEKFTN